MSPRQPTIDDSEAEPDMSQRSQRYLKRLKDRPVRRSGPSIYRPWTPPDDPDKPSFPYLPDFTVEIHHHNSDAIESRPYLSDKYLKSVTHTESVVLNPFMDKVLSPGSDAQAGLVAQLTITASIAIGAVRGAQIVACTVTQGTQKDREGKECPIPFKAAAKIYDPLYYNFKDIIGDDPRDCVYQAENDYRTETAAYKHLDSHKQTGSFAPEYHGSWAFELPIMVNGVARTRTVRLILIELLSGSSLQALRVQNHHNKSMGTDAFHYPQEYRLEVLARAMDGYVRQLKIGLRQGDFAGRNVVLASDNDACKQKVSGLVMPRVALVDYNLATVKIDPRADEAAKLLVNPAAVFWASDLSGDFPGWVPNEWFDIELQQKWLLERFDREDQRDIYCSLGNFLQKLQDAGLYSPPAKDDSTSPRGVSNLSSSSSSPSDPLRLDFGENGFRSFEEKKRLHDYMRATFSGNRAEDASGANLEGRGKATLSSEGTSN